VTLRIVAPATATLDEAAAISLAVTALAQRSAAAERRRGGASADRRSGWAATARREALDDRV
jgi:hypothetical protein